MHQDIIRIQRIASKTDPNAPVRYAIPAVGIQTPQGKRFIPNPTGRESWVFDSLEEARQAIHQAGFASEFEGQVHASQPTNARIAPSRSMDGNLEQAIPILIERLKDNEPTVVAHAALALGSLQATQAITPLCQILGHEDGTVRKHVAEGLAKFGSNVIPQLKDAWDKTLTTTSSPKTPYIRLTLITTCSQWAQRQRQLPAPLLNIAIDGLNDTSWLVRSQAALAIAYAASSSDIFEE